MKETKSITNIHAILHEVVLQLNIDIEDVFKAQSSIDFIHLFDEVDDFRQAHKTQYKLSNILLLSLLCIITEGKCSALAIADNARVHKKIYEKYGLIENGKIPSHDTFRRVLMSLDPIALQEETIGALCEFMRELQKYHSGDNVLFHHSVDGKEVRGSGRSDDTKKPLRNINVLNYYNNSLCLCVNSIPVDGKTNEIPVAQQMLSILNLKNTIITFDALHTQKDTCTMIHKRKGIYVAPVKDNQKTLREEIIARFENPKNAEKIKAPIQREKRKFWFYTLPSNYDTDGFEGMKRFVKMESDKGKKKTVMYFITNGKDEDAIVEAIENRWEIEGDFHKEKDVFLNEDAVHYTNKNAINNVAILDNLALGLMKLYHTFSKNELRLDKKIFRAYPIESLLQLQMVMNDEELLSSIKKQIKQLTKR